MSIRPRLPAMGPLVLAGFLALTIPACAPMVLTPDTPLPASGVTTPTTLVVSDVTSASELSRRKDVYSRIARELPGEFDKTHLFSQVLAERDLGPTPQGRVYVMHLRVVEDVGTIDGAGEALGFIMSWGLVVTIPFSGLVTVAEEHRMRIEARVFDVTGVAPTKTHDAGSNELRMIYDTSNMFPIMKAEYSGFLRLSHPIMSDPSGEELASLQLRGAREIAHQLIAQSLDSIQRLVYTPTRALTPSTCADPNRPI